MNNDTHTDMPAEYIEMTAVAENIPATQLRSRSVSKVDRHALERFFNRTPAQAGIVILAYSRFYGQKIGVLGVLGILAMMFGLVTFFSSSMSLKNELMESEQLLLSASSSSAARTNTTVGRDTQYNNFITDLPGSNEIPQVMLAILSAAESNGIELMSGDYHLKEQETGISEFKLKLPVNGTYPKVRAFVDTALLSVPALALSSFNVERQAVGDRIVAAELEFSLFIRSSQ